MPEEVRRTAVAKFLRSMADLDPQIGPVELCCIWFDDLYVPGEIHPEHYNAGVWDRARRDWQAQFTPDELNILALFHKVFEAEVDAQPTDWPDWDADAGWHRVRDAACLALR